jgi:hypothetical protein
MQIDEIVQESLGAHVADQSAVAAINRALRGYHCAKEVYLVDAENVAAINRALRGYHR